MRVLIVEDERDLATALRAGLTAEGYSVDICADGTAALGFALEGDYDAVVLDLMLPGMSGYRVLERMRAAGSTTPVLVLTAKSGVYDQTEALDSGADDYVVKPFSFPVLVARLRAVLRRSAGPGGLVLTVGDLRLDLLARAVTVGGAPVELTSLEFAVLEQLAQRPGEPVSKDYLLAALWPDGVDDPNLVEARVAALRRKIDEPFGRRSLSTVRGLGYRLLAAS